MFFARLQLGVYIAAAALAAVTSLYLAPFTADDAYIVARYAVNARETGNWVFNEGERVSAMTSPLHGLLLLALARVVRDPLTAYKVVASLAIALSSVTLLVRYGIERRETVLLAAVVTAPSLLLWTFAGLETPLLAAVVTAMASVSSLSPGNRRSLFKLAGLAGVAVVTRYDAVVFAGPVLMAGILDSPRWRDRILAVSIASAPVIVWLFYSWRAFGAVLPTSFYIKTPSAARDVIMVNLRYMAEQTVIAGLGFMAVYVVVRVLLAGNARQTILVELKARWGLHAGILAMLLYGGTMATVHMMFALRHFVPYLGAAAVALAHVARRSDERLDVHGAPARGVALASGAAMVILLIHAFQADALYNRSLQGLGTFGEYDRQGAAGYMRDYIPAMERNAADVKIHWERLNKGRAPRIWTFAAGALPHGYRDAYIFEQLVSFRHNCPAGARHAPDARVWRAHADYIHAFTRHGSVPRLLSPVRGRQVTLVSEHGLRFNGRDEKLLVYYNPAPRPNALPSTVDGPCRHVGQ